MKEFVLISFLVFGASIACAQTEITIADFDSKLVDSLNKRELNRDSSNHSFHLERLKNKESDEGFLPDVTESQRKKSIRNTNILYRRHRENIAKHQLKQYANDSMEGTSPEDLYSPTMCFLENDTLRITIINNLFGGYNFELLLTQNTFTSTFLMDAYREKIFMLDEEDPNLLTQIKVGMKDASLMLKSPLKYEHGEQVTGFFTLTTDDFYRVSDYDPYLVLDEHSIENPDRITVDGTILFKCRMIYLGLIEEE